MPFICINIEYTNPTLKNKTHVQWGNRCETARNIYKHIHIIYKFGMNTKTWRVQTRSKYKPVIKKI